MGSPERSSHIDFEKVEGASPNVFWTLLGNSWGTVISKRSYSGPHEGSPSDASY